MGFRGFAKTESNGYACGISMGWKEDKIQIPILKLHIQFIHDAVCMNDGHNWTLNLIYANPREDNNFFLWKDLEGIAHSMSTKWLMAGDFNDILHMAEKREGVDATRRMCNTFCTRINK